MEPPEYTPHDREVVSCVIQIWKDQPETEDVGINRLHALVKLANPAWTISAKRLKNLLKQYNLLSEPNTFQYVADTVSSPNPDLELPADVRLLVTKARGKALYATKKLKAGETIWKEAPLVLTIPLESIELTRKGHACAYCGKTFQSHVMGSNCKSCAALWCNNTCKKLDAVHSVLWHADATNSKLKYKDWIRYEQFCIANQWVSAYAYGIVLLRLLKEKAGLQPSKGLIKNIDSMATVRQDTRQKAQDAGALGQEQLEAMWKQGFELLHAVVKDVDAEFSYDQYMLGIGMFNINNLDGCIYAVHSHLNHACEPNVSVEIVSRSQGIKVMAKRDINVNEELLVTYVNPELDVTKRREQLRINWGFMCQCKKCKADDKEKKKPSPEPEMRPRAKSVRFDEVPSGAAIHSGSEGGAVVAGG